VDYTIHALNIGQLERVTDAFELKAGRVAYAVLRIAMERAEPKVVFEEIEPSVEDVRLAFEKIIELTGIKVEKKGNGDARPLEGTTAVN
jgi:hypothetical protein